MGCFGYICKGCGTPIIGECFDGGEKCVLIHVRHGREIGRTEGHYDEYGGVVEDPVFRSTDDSNPNGHNEICKSEMEFADSYFNLILNREYRGEVMPFYSYVEKSVKNELKENDGKWEDCTFYDYLPDKIKHCILGLSSMSFKNSPGGQDIMKICEDMAIEALIKEYKYEKTYMELPIPHRKEYSGIVAWHSKCYHNASKAEQENLMPSERDPDQSCGEVRKEFI